MKVTWQMVVEQIEIELGFEISALHDLIIAIEGDDDLQEILKDLQNISKRLQERRLK